MPIVPLASKSDPAKREVVTSERLYNLYAVKAPQESRAPFYLNRTPGMTAWSRLSSDLCRGMFNAGSEGLGVWGSTFYSLNTSGGSTSKGTISGTGDLRWAMNNADEVAIVTGTTNYQYELGGALSVISDNDLPAGVVDVICFNGYMLYLLSDGRVFYSAINDANSIDALDFFTVPGINALVAGIMIGPQAIVWRDTSFEVYRHVPSDADDPFQVVSGAGKPFGCINTHANANVGGIVCFVDQYGAVRSIGSGYLPEQISNEGVQSDIKALSDKSEIRLFGYVDGDRGFLIVRSSAWCWVYDFKEARWHNRKSYQRNTWQAKYYMRFANKDLVAPDQSGDLFYLDDASHTEDGEHIVWEFVCPPANDFPNGASNLSARLDIEAGTALGASAAAADQAPVMTLFKSIDGGKTRKSMGQRSLGARGEWRKSIRWNRCGKCGAEGVIWSGQGSAGVPHAIMNLFVEGERIAA